MSNKEDLITTPLDNLYTKLREWWPKVKDDEIRRKKCEALGSDCKWQLSQLLVVDVDKLDDKLYGCVSFGRNGLCYTCHLMPARPHGYNCQRCSYWPSLGITKALTFEKKLESMKTWRKEEKLPQNNEDEQLAKDAEEVFGV